MATDCTVRKLGANDAEAWASLRREALETCPLIFGASIPDEPKQLVDLILSRLAEPEAAVFGAFVAGSLVGTVGIRRHPNAKERHKSTLWGMYVAATSRRTGAGEALLRTAIEQARSWPHVNQVHLAVSELAADARRLYERNGFQEWGREPRALCWQGQCVSETHMVLTL
jgi:GNAT superfamily N-acetyltransferase